MNTSHTNKQTQSKPVHLGLLTLATILLVNCGSPRRPPNVPAQATWVEGAKTGWWQRCINTERQTTRCTVWNEGGEVLLDEPFLPIDGGPAPSTESLVLRGRGPGTGVYQVCLANGPILVPQSRFSELKESIEGRKP